MRKGLSLVAYQDTFVLSDKFAVSSCVKPRATIQLAKLPLYDGHVGEFKTDSYNFKLLRAILVEK